MSTRKRDESAGTTTARGVRRSRASQRDESYQRPQRDDERADTLHHNATPHEHYRHEKARRQRSKSESADPLADAKREYKALLAAEAARGKGGRPRKNAAKPAAKSAASAASVDEDELEGETEEVEVEVDAEADTDTDADAEADDESSEDEAQ